MSDKETSAIFLGAFNEDGSPVPSTLTVGERGPMTNSAGQPLAEILQAATEATEASDGSHQR